MQQPEILIKAQAKHDGYSLVLIGLISLCLVIFFALDYWLQAKFVLLFLSLVALVTLFIGINKCLEPPHSFSLTPTLLRYTHRYGTWQLAWADIAAINQVSESFWFERVELPYVGIRLHKLDTIIDNISPRLASRLIHEQRPLIQFCIQHQLIKFTDGIINFTPYKIANREIKGPKAAFLYQAVLLKQALGFHLYLPENSLDRDCQHFVSLLKNCVKSANSYDINNE